MSKKLAIKFTLLQEMRLAIVSLVLVNSRVADQVGLHTTDIQLLQLIEIQEDPTPKLLADLTGITTGGITVVLDRLEKMGLIKRNAHPTDRRKVVVSLNGANVEERFKDAYATITEDTFKVMSQYTDDELATIADFFSRIKNIK